MCIFCNIWSLGHRGDHGRGFTQTVAWLWGLAGLVLGTVVLLKGFKYLRTTAGLKRTRDGSAETEEANYAPAEAAEACRCALFLDFLEWNPS